MVAIAMLVVMQLSVRVKTTNTMYIVGMDWVIPARKMSQAGCAHEKPPAEVTRSIVIPKLFQNHSGNDTGTPSMDCAR